MPDIALETTNRILGRGLITAETVYQDFRELLARELAKRRNWTAAELIGMAQALLDEANPIFVELFGETNLAAWLAGYHWTSEKFPEWLERELSAKGPPKKPPTTGLILPFGGDEDEPIVRFPLIEKAAESLAKRGVLTREEFDAASEAAKRQAFTVAGTNSADTIAEIRDTLAQVTEQGASLEEFRDLIADRIEASPIGPAHLENVYRTNIQGAFRDGRETLASNPVVSAVFPYQEYIAIHDGRVRDEHLALETLGLDGTGVYRRDDPVWDFFTPPWDFNCRCGVNLLTIEAAARRGVREAQEWLKTGLRPTSPEWRIYKIPFRGNPGFGHRGVAA